MIQHKGQHQPLKTEQDFVSLNEASGVIIIVIKTSTKSFYDEVDSEGIVSNLHLKSQSSLAFHAPIGREPYFKKGDLSCN